MDSVGNKFDDDKDPWGLLPMGPVRQIVKVLAFGAKKYGAENWRKVPDGRIRYYSAAMRHLVQWWWDQDVEDSESGLSHLAHAACCIIFLMTFEENHEP